MIAWSWKKFIASVLCIGAFGAHAAAALSPDPTGLWFDPNESGWGMSVVQQADTVFVALFVYDDARRPAWYVASDVTFNGVTLLPENEPVFTGTLYRTSGPWFGAPFDPAAVSATPVGTIQLNYVVIDGARQLMVAYAVDGVPVFKRVRPQTWSTNVASLAGDFNGAVRLTPDAPASCPDFASFVNPGAAVIHVSAGSGDGKVELRWSSGIDTGCVASGPYMQEGQIGSMSGTLACGPIPLPPALAPVQVTEIVANANGFLGKLSVQRNGCSYSGRIGGVRQP